MVGNILAAASITLGGGDLKGRAIAHTSVTISTPETIEAPAFQSGSAGTAGATANLHYHGNQSGVSLQGGS
jgi:hypothetical protein